VQRITSFLDAATQSLDIAIYDLRLEADPATALLQSFEAARQRGVQVRLMFNQDHAQAIPVPPPPEIDWTFIDRLKAAGVATKPVPGIPDLMHHKYVVRDAETPQAEVLSGSTNWTNDSWTREENVIFTVASRDLASAYSQDFQQLWDKPVVALSGRVTQGWVDLADSTSVRVYFCPGRALKLVHAMSRSIASARRRIRVCSPVITSGPILGTLAEAIEHPSADILGVYDATQMDEVQNQWSSQPTTSWKIQAFKSIVASARFGSKRSTPYAVGSVHDFMHAKILVADDYVYVGSFNLSHSGEMNAENVLQVESKAIADQCAAYVEQVAARYGGPHMTGS
jgi:phosphatidylserine/phosphatidylglycerophosphate/cardiolipin synthase-like enzyme